jgi:hypothetical protein
MMVRRVEPKDDGVSSERAPWPAPGTPGREKLLARLADRAKFIRLETVRLAEIPGAGHYTGTFSAETLADAGVAAARFRRLGVPDEHVLLGPPAALYAHYQLDAAGVESVARQLLAR